MEVDEVVKVKEEPSSDHEVEAVDAPLSERILLIMRKYEPRKVTDQILDQELAGVDKQSIVEAINELLSRESIELLKQGNQILYGIVDSSQLKGIDDQEKVVLSLIKAAGNKGIWHRDIRLKSNIGTHPLTKVIKSMENRKLIKAVKSVAAAKRKVYMLYDLQPDKSLTGGAWYSNEQDFEEEFVKILSQQCHRFLLERMRTAKKSHPDNLLLQIRASRTSINVVLDYIDKLQISKVKLTVSDVGKILQSLVYDGLAERSASITETGAPFYEYRASEPFVKTTGLMRVPCGVCPVFDDCHDEGDVTPSKCIYFTDWF